MTVTIPAHEAIQRSISTRLVTELAYDPEKLKYLKSHADYTEYTEDIYYFTGLTVHEKIWAVSMLCDKSRPKVYAVKDIWHGKSAIVGEVRSDDPIFNGDIREFFGWILQHGGSVFSAYLVN